MLYTLTVTKGAFTMAGNSMVMRYSTFAVGAGAFSIGSPPIGGLMLDTIMQAVGMRQSELFGFGCVASLGGLGLTASAPAYTYRPGALVSDVIRLQEDVLSAGKYAQLSNESVHLVDALIRTYPLTATEAVGLSELAAVVRGMIVLDHLGVVSTVDTKATYFQTLAQTLRLSDSFRRFFGDAVLETIGIATTNVLAYRPGAEVSDDVRLLADITQSRLVFRVDVADAIDLVDADVLKMIFKGDALLDGLRISAAYLSPGGGFTTWAVNTRTTAVTEYQNYQFNSFAQVGRKYLGANSSGLFELEGARDDTRDIIAHIKSGLIQFGGAHLTSFSAIYLGMRGDGQFLLRLVTGDGRTYTYGVKSQDMLTTKVRLGKGLRARYFAFELISTGPDFDLESVEFVPIVAQRRV